MTTWLIQMLSLVIHVVVFPQTYDNPDTDRQQLKSKNIV